MTAASDVAVRTSRTGGTPRRAKRQLDVALPARCDVAIVGAGYAGLSAALTLARAGRSVVVLDADAPGYGASSRSGGMIGHGHRLSYTKLIEQYGARKGEGAGARGHGVAAVPEGPDRRRSDRRRAAVVRPRARRVDASRLRHDGARRRCVAARSRHAHRRAEQGRRAQRSRDGSVPGRIAVSGARRRASRVAATRTCLRGPARRARWSPATRRDRAAAEARASRSRRRADASTPRKSWSRPTATRVATTPDARAPARRDTELPHRHRSLGRELACGR